MKRMENENSFLIIFVSCIVVIITIFYFNINMSFSNIVTSFGGISGNISIPYNITYSSNWPDSSLENKTSISKDRKQHLILDNMFEVPVGYKFVNWNTVSDGSGQSYMVNDTMDLSSNVELFAQWEYVGYIDSVRYGDINLNGVIDENDYLLLKDYIFNNGVLNSFSLLNSDVNNDNRIDYVDVDIIKHAYLGTEGYKDILPYNPILIYKIYDSSDNENDNEVLEGNNSNNNNSNNNNNSGNNSNNNNSGTGGTGSGNSGSGTGNVAGNNKNPGSTGSVNGNVSGSGSVDIDDNDSNIIINEDNKESKVYEFKYINNGKEYAITTCKVMENNTCNLVLPEIAPSMEGYVFSGWSLVEGCSPGSVFVSSYVVEQSNTYYSCFKIIDEDEETDDNSYMWIIVISIWLVAVMLIYRLVKYFKKIDN